MCKSGSRKTWRTCKAQWSSLGNQVKQHLAEGQSTLREVKSYLVISQCLSHCQPLFWVEMEEKEHPKSLTSRNLRWPPQATRSNAAPLVPFLHRLQPHRSTGAMPAPGHMQFKSISGWPLKAVLSNPPQKNQFKYLPLKLKGKMLSVCIFLNRLNAMILKPSASSLLYFVLIG